eukprot:4761409-Pleurochrysis_carterae.AAC.4
MTCATDVAGKSADPRGAAVQRETAQDEAGVGEGGGGDQGGCLDESLVDEHVDWGFSDAGDDEATNDLDWDIDELA